MKPAARTLNPDQLRDIIRTMPAPLPASERRRHSVAELGEGNFFQYNGATYRVQSVNAWRVDDSVSTELETVNLTTGATAYLEWWKDPELHLLLSTVRLELADLGLRPGRVEEVEEVRHGGAAFYYDSDYDAAYGETKRAVRIRLYRAEDGRAIYVQKWSDGYSAWLSEEIDPNAVEILTLGQAA
jgi:Domain of unknown function (DUF4178)